MRPARHAGATPHSTPVATVMSNANANTRPSTRDDRSVPAAPSGRNDRSPRDTIGATSRPSAPPPPAIHTLSASSKDAIRRRGENVSSQELEAALRTKSQEFFTSSVGQWDRLREELFGGSFHLLPFLLMVAVLILVFAIGINAVLTRRNRPEVGLATIVTRGHGAQERAFAHPTEEPRRE